LPENRANACEVITKAMMAHPEMVGGPERFDTRLMQVTAGRLVSKGGAEGYQGIGVLPGVMGSNSPGVGIAIKISDGDLKGRAINAVSLEVLRLLGVLTASELEELAEFGPSFPLKNFRKFLVGQGRTHFELEWKP
jgi:L-asparaginase II